LNVKDTLYGTTSQCGGSSCYGTVYSIATKGVEKVLRRFTGSGGGNPLAGLIVVNGKLYGATTQGSKSACDTQGCGTIFALTP
jgi:uncharacterized repeat protein (TIGR03803 family)